MSAGEVFLCDPDCDERAACEKVGEIGHFQCGDCDVHDLPRHHCGCLVMIPDGAA